MTSNCEVNNQYIKYKMSHILRDIRLSKLTGKPMGDKASKLNKFWDDLWCDMRVYVDVIKGEIKCWKDSHNYYYFHQDGKNTRLWCNYDEVWSFFDKKLCLSYNETQELIQIMLTLTLSYKVNTSESFRNHPAFLVDGT